MIDDGQKLQRLITRRQQELGLRPRWWHAPLHRLLIAAVIIGGTFL